MGVTRLSEVFYAKQLTYFYFVHQKKKQKEGRKKLRRYDAILSLLAIKRGS